MKKVHSFLVWGVLLTMLFLGNIIWADSPEQLAEQDGPAGMTLIAVPEGSFSMGRAGLAEPVHPVVLNGFLLSKYETTYAQWIEVYQWAVRNGYQFTNPGTAGHEAVGPPDKNPVARINWFDAVKWCNALSEMEGKKPCYYTDAAHTKVFREGQVPLGNDWVDRKTDGYRLPTESELSCRHNEYLSLGRRL